MMLTRRRFLSLSAAAAASAGIPLRAYPQDATSLATGDPQALPAYLQSGSKKKGLGMNTYQNPIWKERVLSVHCKWFYSWAGFLPGDTPPGMEFIPMIRSRHASPEMIAKIRRSWEGYDIKALLGLNEPDKEKQDGYTVEQALELWPKLMETGLPLGSPGCVHPDNEWMIQFMKGVEERELRVDFVCVHSYGNPNAQAFITRLEKVHKLFERPLWITEFGVGDWSAKSVEENKHSAKTVLKFMEDVLPKLEKLDFLERYAWFPTGPNSPPLGTSALFDQEGALTPLGEFYRDA